MAFNLGQIRNLIAETIERQGLYSEVAVNLLLGTMAAESLFGTYLRQLNGGPALGIFQMEPATERDIWNNYLYHGRIPKRKAIYDISGIRSADSRALEGNLYYAICMARLHYRRVKAPFPEASDVAGMAYYWMTFYNTPKGKGTQRKFIRNYKKYIGDK